MKRFKGVRREHLKSGTAFKYSGEAQPLVHDGVIYLSTGANDVFALDAKSVYLGKYVGTLVTMNAGSGRGVWSAAVGDWRKGDTITSAPPYYDGMVMTGLSGGEFGISVSAGEKTNLQKSPVAEHLAQVEKQVRNGGGAMPPFSGVPSAEEIDAVAHDVVDQIAPKA